MRYLVPILGLLLAGCTSTAAITHEAPQVQLVSLVSDGVVRGRGSFVSSSGVIVTSRHVVDRSGAIYAIRWSGQSDSVTQVWFASGQDLALVAIDAADTPFAIISTGVLTLGESIWLVTPQGIDRQPVSVLDTWFATDKGFRSGYGAIGQSVTEGMSGSPLIDRSGHIVAILTARMLEHEGAYILPITQQDIEHIHQ